MHVVIFSGGKVEDGFFVREALKKAELVIAADTGAESALQFGITPNGIVGDMDSLEKKILRLAQNDSSIELIRSIPEKDETDTQLAVDVAIQKGATEISILGGVQDNRLDHVLANVFLSAYGYKRQTLNIKRQKEKRPHPNLLLQGEGSSTFPLLKGEGGGEVFSPQISFINGNQKIWIEKGPAKVHLTGEKGDLLSLIPVSETVEEITTENLQYPLQNETLFFEVPRGISNIFLQNMGIVSFQKGRLLFVHTRVR